MRTALLAFCLIGCGGADFTSGATESDSGHAPITPVSNPTGTGGSGSGGSESPSKDSLPSNNGGKPTSEPNGNGGSPIEADGGSQPTVSTGGVSNGTGGSGSGGSPSNNGGNPSGSGGATVSTGGSPVASGGASPIGSGGMVGSGGQVGNDLRCPPSPNSWLACEPGQYVRACNNSLSEILIAPSWSGLDLAKVTSDSVFPIIAGQTDSFGSHLQTACLGSPVTFTLPAL